MSAGSAGDCDAAGAGVSFGLGGVPGLGLAAGAGGFASAVLPLLPGFAGAGAAAFGLAPEELEEFPPAGGFGCAGGVALPPWAAWLAGGVAEEACCGAADGMEPGALARMGAEAEAGLPISSGTKGALMKASVARSWRTICAETAGSRPSWTLLRTKKPTSPARTKQNPPTAMGRSKGWRWSPRSRKGTPTNSKVTTAGRMTTPTRALWTGQNFSHSKSGRKYHSGRATKAVSAGFASGPRRTG